MGEQKKSKLSEFAAKLGRKGGRAGTGVNKRRGNASYYRDIQRKSVKSRLLGTSLQLPSKEN